MSLNEKSTRSFRILIEILIDNEDEIGDLKGKDGGISLKIIFVSCQ